MEFIGKDSKHYAEAIRLFGMQWVDQNAGKLTDLDVRSAASAARNWLFDDLAPDHWFKRQMLTWWREHVEARPADDAKAMAQTEYAPRPELQPETPFKDECSACGQRALRVNTALGHMCASCWEAELA